MQTAALCTAVTVCGSKTFTFELKRCFCFFLSEAVFQWLVSVQQIGQFLLVTYVWHDSLAQGLKLTFPLRGFICPQEHI